MSGAGFNEGKGKPFSSADIRFTAKGDAVYAFVMGWPQDGKVLVHALRAATPHLKKRIARVELVSTGRPLAFRQSADGLQVTMPAYKPALAYANVLKIT